MIQTMLPTLTKGGRIARGLLGVGIQDLNDDLAKQKLRSDCYDLGSHELSPERALRRRDDRRCHASAIEHPRGACVSRAGTRTRSTA